MPKVPVVRKGVVAPTAKQLPTFDLHEFLDSADIAEKATAHARNGVLYAQGDPAQSVLYIQ